MFCGGQYTLATMANKAPFDEAWMLFVEPRLEFDGRGLNEKRKTGKPYNYLREAIRFFRNDLLRVNLVPSRSKTL